MLMYISSVYAAQISFEYYYDQYSPADIGSEVSFSLFGSVKLWPSQKSTSTKSDTSGAVASTPAGAYQA